MKIQFLIFATLAFTTASRVAQKNVSASAPLPGYKLAWSDENVSVSGGKLILAVKKENAGDKHYTGAGVISKRAFKYGYYDSRFKVPPGAGWHTSFWLQKYDGSGGTNPQASARNWTSARTIR